MQNASIETFHYQINSGVIRIEANQHISYQIPD